MNIILTAINAKYIHSNLAVYSLKSYAKEYAEHITIAEYTINQQVDVVLSELYKKQPDMVCFSCYIWNISYVEELVRELAKILPNTIIWLGGPEVSYDSEAVLKRLGEVTGVMMGEGEETFQELVEMYHSHILCLEKIKSIAYRDENGIIKSNQWRAALDLSTVPFIYEDMAQFTNKIIYYETSRGCPFTCSYCLSSIDKKLRFRSLELVKRELGFFLSKEVSQVKFVDRTFNCNHKHAIEIWAYLLEHDNGITNFHFEISADLLNEEELSIIEKMRPGLIQLEIGVQSTNPLTIQEIKRTMNYEEVKRIVKRVQRIGNVHQHLDLIAGLPYEGIQSFRQSFNDVYELYPEQLQLGFLKVLKGSFMEKEKETYGLIYKDTAPYEVLFTKWLSYNEMLKLKRIEEMVELYYNSAQFQRTLQLLEGVFSTPFDMYEELGKYYEEQKLHLLSHSRVARYEILLAFAKLVDGEQVEMYKEALIYDLYLRENMKNRPEFAGEQKVSKEEMQEFYEQEEKEHRFLQNYEGYDKRQLRKMTHIEGFHYNFNGKNPKRKEKKTYILFDYINRSKLTHEAATFTWEELK